ncbi:MAG: DUF3795 domain-containing protein [Oscillospiraceae bacterium]|nr:DUF3795 domain-containing protein [Oscillospiraceae bacterium]
MRNDTDRHGFDIPDSPPENYRHILNMRNAAQIEADKAAPPEEKPPMYGCCGVNCRECEYFYDLHVHKGDTDIGCRGCLTEGGECEVRTCCLGKWYRSCIECTDFPCDNLKAVSEEEDAENLMRLKAEKDKQTDFFEVRRNAFITGGLTGLVIGTTLGLITGNEIEFLICGLITGVAVPAIKGFDDKK